MADEDGLLALQGLHNDLIAFSDNRLQDIERLVNELDSRVEEFRALLDKNGKTDASRRQVQTGEWPLFKLKTIPHTARLLLSQRLPQY